MPKKSKNKQKQVRQKKESKEKEPKSKKKTVAEHLNDSLKPFESGYRNVKGLLSNVKNKSPFLFDRVKSLFSFRFASVEKSKKLQANPNVEKFTDVLASEMANNFPNIDIDTVTKVVKDKKSKGSFIEKLSIALRSENAPIEKDYTTIKKEKLFKRVLIANRGEIALRIIRACRELDIEAIQIYTKPDAKSLAVKFANKSINLGSNAADYLNMEKIIKVAKKVKADAIHPGYGFLAENAQFAKMCEEKNIKFIGPSAAAILALGDKINAKNLIKNSGVPIMEGTYEPVKSIEEGINIAKQIGFPIIIKAAAGGGGKGMRIVNKEEEFAELFTACQTEAESAFKNKDVFIEKYIVEPHHIEFQILADQKGNVIHLGERDCSIQRRHQKLIEEAPSPALSAELRKQIGDAALKVASATKYEGAGTVEFLLDENGKFYFMEMNTRIQVEHGITEMITGIDLVKEQIKIACGAEMAYKQEDITFAGWAIECRINAECPNDGFCPETGTIVNYLPPGGPGIRVCASCHQGQEVSPHYDSLLAKLICYGKTREEAIDRMQRALDEFIIEGVETTIPFHKAVLDSKAFQKGDITTSFIDKNKIMEKVKKYSKQKKKINKEEKAIIITTAVSEYLKKKSRINDKNSQWAASARYEAVNNSNNQDAF